MELFHVLNRGVDKRKIFLDDQDRYRFIHDLFEFNDEESANTTFYKFNVIARRKIVGQAERKPRKLLVDVLAFCLMQNHYHLLLRPRSEKGITRFIKKVNMGYARYFNERYDRKGALFEGRYKSVTVKDEQHFIHLPYYIHLNPLDFFMPEWRKRESKNADKALKFLENYRWSSHQDYLGKKNFPSVTQRDLLNKVFGGASGYIDGVRGWLKDLELDDTPKIFLE